ncbi:winged helix-turn-helix transcriptional regulator [Jatrophihabitans sp. YIM 134969]
MAHDTAVLEGPLADRDAWTDEQCPVRGTLDIVGTRSAILLLREAFYGTTRFDDFAARVRISDAVAAARLRELTAAGLFEKVPYREDGARTRYEYVLTESGRDLVPAVLALFEWGSRHLSADGRGPLRMRHDGCGADIHLTVTCDEGHAVPLGELAVQAAPRRTRRPTS